MSSIKPEIEIFYSNMCSACHQAMDFFNQRKYAFDSYLVKWDKEGKLVEDENGKQLIEKCGNVDFVPQIFINNKHIPGWKTLEPLIKSGEIDKLLL